MSALGNAIKLSTPDNLSASRKIAKYDGPYNMFDKQLHDESVHVLQFDARIRRSQFGAAQRKS